MHPLTREGMWIALREGYRATEKRTGLLLDRDGVLIEDVGYISDPAQVRLLPGAVDMLRWAGQAGVPVAVVTNQSGIARGMFDWDSFSLVQAAMERHFRHHGIEFDAVLACPFHPDFRADFSGDWRYWRKPGPGMLIEACRLLGVDCRESWMVGDKTSDVSAARAAGLAGAVRIACPPFSENIAGLHEIHVPTVSEVAGVLADSIAAGNGRLG